MQIREVPSKDDRYSLFPYNYINCVHIGDKVSSLKKLLRFENLVKNISTNEHDIISFIKEEKAYLLIGSIIKKYFYFGHHATYIFPEFQLGSEYRVDYLLIGKNSDGYHFLFIELESPNDSTTIDSGYEGKSMRKGLNQISDWEFWLESNYSYISSTLKKYLGEGKQLKEEFYSFDKSRMNYAVVVGRRSDFNNTTYRKRRKLEENKIMLLHYDNLIDNSKDWISGSLM